MFWAVLVDKREGVYAARLVRLEEAALPEGEVQVRVAYSALNYKDALAITGKGPVVRAFPMVPGIDFVGTVEASTHAGVHAGDAVVLTGWGAGELHWGGLAERARVPGDWLLPLPSALSARRVMALGTAGVTAMLAVMTLESRGVTPGSGEILVTGAGGGVGGIAVQVLHRLGYRVVAATGRVSEADYFAVLGADEVIGREQVGVPGKLLGKERWAGAVDTVGGRMLADVCMTLRHGGVVAACGMAGGMMVPASVAPFILRGVSLIGIESVYLPRAMRERVWRRLVDVLDFSVLDMMTREVPLAQAISAAEDLLAGRIRGRVVVTLHPTEQ